MPNVTLSMEKKLIEKSRKYARKHGKSLNELIRELLQKTVNRSHTNSTDELLELMNKASGNSKGQVMTRENIYDKKILY